MNARRFGAFLAQCRREKHLTQAQLAEKLHVTDKAVSRWERGVGFPDIQLLEPLADALGVRVDELIRAERSVPKENRNAETAAVVQAATALSRSLAQERNASAIAAGTIALTGLLAFFCRVANLGGALLLGGIAAAALVSLYLYMENRADRASRTIYAVIAAICAAVFLGIVILVISRRFVLLDVLPQNL